MLCRYCGKEVASNGVFCAFCSVSRPNNLTKEQYLVVLSEIRTRVASGVAIGLDDSTVIGAKHTHCAWGVCTDSAEVWDKPEYHIWPMDFSEHGRVAPLGRPSKCPLDGRRAPPGWGCFYRCLAFRPSKGFVLTAERVLELYDVEIGRLREACDVQT